MRIVDITVNATEATYPQHITIDILWSQAIQRFSVQNLIFETEFAKGITITGYTPKINTPTPQQVYLGQTLVAKKNIYLVNPYTLRIRFQVSPWMNGSLRVSNQSWNKPLSLRVNGPNGQEGDWSPFLAAGAFSGITCKTYYPSMDPTGTTSLAFDQTLQGFPLLRAPWTPSPGTLKRYSGLNVKISQDNDFTPKPIATWEEGNFWWWSTAGCMYATYQQGYPFNNYYSTNDTATCSGPPGYTYTGAGGQMVTSTQMPLYDELYQYKTVTNSFGSKLATNTRGGNANIDYNWATTPWIGTSPTCTDGGRNVGVGRMEGWVLANPNFGDPLTGMPETWNNQAPSSVNLNCLAPWRLAKDTDRTPILIQTYYQINWIFSTQYIIN